MSEGGKAVLLIDKYSGDKGSKKRLYGKMKEIVKVIDIRGNVAIVEGKERFPIRIEFLKPKQ